jgi:hypothetical protein
MVVIKFCIEFETKNYWNPFIGSSNEEKHYWDLLLHHLVASKLKFICNCPTSKWSIVEFRLFLNYGINKIHELCYFMLL